MRLPLELLNLVLDHAKKSYTDEQFLALRVVDSKLPPPLLPLFTELFERFVPGRNL